MKFENTYVSNFEGAFRGMRNPLNSWSRSDSRHGIGDTEKTLNACSYVTDCYMATGYPELERGSAKFLEAYTEINLKLDINGIIRHTNNCNEYSFIGPNDMDLAKRLIKAGPEHRKFLRQIQVSVDMTAPLYVFKEFDTYKVGTTANSTSTMHKITSKPITLDCFEIDDFEPIADYNEFVISQLIPYLEDLRAKYLETKDKKYWKELVRWLPNGWLQTRTITMNYEIIRSICKQREGHKLTEWKAFIKWASTLPYAEDLIFN